MSTDTALTPEQRAIVLTWLAERADALRRAAQSCDSASAYADSSQARAADLRDARDYRARADALDVERTILGISR